MNLTKREQEILGLIAQGYSNKQITECLCITIGTLRRHLLHLYQKTGVSDTNDQSVKRVRLVLTYFNKGENYGGRL